MKKTKIIVCILIAVLVYACSKKDDLNEEASQPTQITELTAQLLSDVDFINFQANAKSIMSGALKSLKSMNLSKAKMLERLSVIDEATFRKGINEVGMAKNKKLTTMLLKKYPELRKLTKENRIDLFKNVNRLRLSKDYKSSVPKVSSTCEECETIRNNAVIELEIFFENELMTIDLTYSDDISACAYNTTPSICENGAYDKWYTAFNAACWDNGLEYTAIDADYSTCINNCTTEVVPPDTCYITEDGHNYMVIPCGSGNRILND